MADMSSPFISDSGISSLLQQTQAAQKPYLQAAKKNEAALTKTRADLQQLEQQPAPAPELQNIPKAPPQHAEQTNPFAVFAHIAPALAIFGSLATRAPLTAALNTGAAAMKAYQDGRQEEAGKLYQQWKAETDTALKQNQIELERYKAALDDRNMSIREKLAQMQSLGAEFKDNIMLANVGSQNLKSIADIIKARMTGQAALDRSMAYINYLEGRPPKGVKVPQLSIAQKEKNAQIEAAKSRVNGYSKQEIQAALNSPVPTARQRMLVNDLKLSQMPLYEAESGPGPSPVTAGIPKEAVQYLKDNIHTHPELREQFDKKYGAGSAAKVLGE